MEYDAATLDPGKFLAVTKVWVTQRDADAFFLNQPGMIRDKAAEADGHYVGKWTYAQLCEIEKSPLVSFMYEIRGPTTDRDRLLGSTK
jgi:hypothetical protein